MGIFKKLLRKKDKSTEKPHKKEIEPDVPRTEPFDFLAPAEEESIPIPVEQREGRKTEAAFPEPSPSLEPEPSPSPVEEEIPPLPSGPFPAVRERLAEAERGLGTIEQAVIRSVVLVPTVGAFIPRLKILLVEAKIKLAEAEIKVAEAEMMTGDLSSLAMASEELVSMAEGKIAECEHILADLRPTAREEMAALSRVKIALAGEKIRLAEIKIALAGGVSTPPRTEVVPTVSSIKPVPPVPGYSFEPSVPPSPVPMEKVSIVRHDDLADREVVGAPPPVTMFPPVQSEDLPSREYSMAPVRIQEDRDLSQNVLKDRIVMEEMGEGPSPFETEIKMERVKIHGEKADAPLEPATQERVKIRTDERDSAWIEEDGSLKRSGAERKGKGTEISSEETRPRITISQAAVGQTLVIEELNKEGILLRKQGDLAGALSCFERVLALEPTNEAALHNRGVALRSLGRFEEALASFEQALESEPDNLLIWFNKGFVLGKLERYEEALKAFDRVLALRPDHAEGWYSKGKILQILGRQEESNEHLKKARELGHR
jgi:hypothetical protein